MNAQPLKTVFLDYDTVSNGDLDLERAARGGRRSHLVRRRARRRLRIALRDADVVLLNKLDLTRELLFGAPRLKLVALAATGTNNVDLHRRARTGNSRLQRARLLHRLGGPAGVGIDIEPHSTCG